VIATIFLPLSSSLGFFGQNFSVMIAHITHEWTFWVLGVGSMLATCAGLLVFFRRKSWCKAERIAARPRHWTEGQVSTRVTGSNFQLSDAERPGPGRAGAL
jgi:hypothetical protein